jgi:hypothetical protein
MRIPDDQLKHWNQRLAAEGLSVIDVSTMQGVNTQFGAGPTVDDDGLVPQQLPTLTREQYEQAEREIEYVGSLVSYVAGRLPSDGAAAGLPAGGYGYAGRRRVPARRPSHYQKGPLRVLDRRCDEQGCTNRVSGYRVSKRFCAAHSTPAATQRRYRKSSLKSERKI